MKKPKKKHYINDTDAGIRPINKIRSLPSCQLTDEEFVKEFFERFEAKALVMLYIDDKDERHTFGRLKKGAQPFWHYRQLLGNMERVMGTTNIKEID